MADTTHPLLHEEGWQEGGQQGEHHEGETDFTELGVRLLCQPA